ncbi:MAG: M48 family metallopeptidase, partial [Actinomycetota bacterium]|nr:M48 family metallopeptidase [Actinomycetota bacterium]
MFQDVQTANKWRSLLLLASGFLLLVVAGEAVGYYLGAGPFGLVIAVVIAIASTGNAYWNSDKIALRITGAHRVDQMSHPQLMNVIQEMALASGMPMPKVAVIADPAPNAFATGRDPQHATVAVTTGLLERMNREQLQGVLAHELSHVANRDTLVATLAVTIAGTLAILCDLAWRMSLFGGSTSRRRSNDSNAGPLQLILLVAAVLAIVIAPLAARLLQSAISRRREQLADATAVSYTRNPAGLRSALEVLEADSTVVRHTSRATSHLWIESPLD